MSPLLRRPLPSRLFLRLPSLRSPALALVVALAASWALLPAAQAQTPTNDATYQQVCATCHASGVAGAPKTGDRKTWSKLIAEGQTVLTAHGYVGVRGMPARGGQADLSVEAFAAAVVHMANQAGASWKAPDERQLQAIRQEIAKREKQLAAKGAKKQ